MSCEDACEFEPRYHTTRSPVNVTPELMEMLGNYDTEDVLKIIEQMSGEQATYVWDICPHCGDTRHPDGDTEEETTEEEEEEKETPEPEKKPEVWHSL